MKKVLLISAALLAAVGVKAEVTEYDFGTNPTFFTTLYAPEEEDGLAWSGEYDFIDKNGKDVNTNGEMFCSFEEDENGGKIWHGLNNRAISLVDGQTYTLEGTAVTADGIELTPIDMNEPFISWDQDGVGPSRVHYFNGWNNTESFEEKDYGAASENDFIASKGAIGFLRNGNNGARKGTFVQFPTVNNPSKMTIWIGNQGGSYHEMGLYAEVTPVVDGVAGEVISVQGPESYEAKRYYKLDVALPADLKGDVAFRVGCGGSQVQIYHVVIEHGEDNAVDAINAVDTENAPVYNVFGVQVDENYKGIVIKNGVKSIRH